MFFGVQCSKARVVAVSLWGTQKQLSFTQTTCTNGYSVSSWDSMPPSEMVAAFTQQWLILTGLVSQYWWRPKRAEANGGTRPAKAWLLSAVFEGSWDIPIIQVYPIPLVFVARVRLSLCLLGRRGDMHRGATSNLCCRSKTEPPSPVA